MSQNHLEAINATLALHAVMVYNILSSPARPLHVIIIKNVGEPREENQGQMYEQDTWARNREMWWW